MAPVDEMSPRKNGMAAESRDGWLRAGAGSKRRSVFAGVGIDNERPKPVTTGGTSDPRQIDATSDRQLSRGRPCQDRTDKSFGFRLSRLELSWNDFASGAGARPDGSTGPRTAQTGGKRMVAGACSQRYLQLWSGAA